MAEQCRHLLNSTTNESDDDGVRSNPSLTSSLLQGRAGRLGSRLLDATIWGDTQHIATYCNDRNSLGD